MSKSIFNLPKECWFCGTTQNLENHHIFFGSRRKMADKYGLTIWLCHNHHTGTNQAVHNSRRMDMELKCMGQAQFESIYGHQKFMDVFGKNYIGYKE